MLYEVKNRPWHHSPDRYSDTSRQDQREVSYDSTKACNSILRHLTSEFGLRLDLVDDIFINRMTRFYSKQLNNGTFLCRGRGRRDSI